MGLAANERKDRECRICGDIRLRTAREMKEHYDTCLEVKIIEDRLEAAGLASLAQNRIRLPWF